MLGILNSMEIQASLARQMLSSVFKSSDSIFRFVQLVNSVPNFPAHHEIGTKMALTVLTTPATEKPSKSNFLSPITKRYIFV